MWLINYPRKSYGERIEDFLYGTGRFIYSIYYRVDRYIFNRPY